MEKLEDIIKEVLGINPKEIDEKMKFIDMEIWDSMTFMYFIMQIENVFQISLTNEEIIKMDCIKVAKEIIESKI